MTDFFCNIYSSIQDKNAFLKQIRFYSVLRVLTRWSANILLPLYYLCTRRNSCYALHTTDKKDNQLIVSLTSFPARINKVWIVIECMLRQTVKPDRIILWLSKEQFKDMTSLPDRLVRLQSRGLDIRLMDGDIRSHKKYTHTLQQYPEACLVMIDDDFFYRSTLIEELMEQHTAHPEAVIAHYTHDMHYQADGTLMSYNSWEDNVLDGAHLFFGSGGGTLVPPGTIHADVTDTATAVRLCPNADDVWLNAMVRLQKTPIIHTPHKDILLPVIQWRNISLFSSNETGGNDIQIKQLTDYCLMQYGVNPFAQ